MNSDRDTIIAPATAAGGAIAVIRVSGDDATTLCDRIFRGRRPLASAEGYTVHYGRIIEPAAFVGECPVSGAGNRGPGESSTGNQSDATFGDTAAGESSAGERADAGGDAESPESGEKPLGSNGGGPGTEPCAAAWREDPSGIRADATTDDALRAFSNEGQTDATSGDAATGKHPQPAPQIPVIEKPGQTREADPAIAAERIIDDVLVTVFRAPHSYTGENAVEISCHGSQYIVSEILRLLLAAGARMAEPGEFTIRAYLNGKMDLSQAEAVADVIAASSRAAHALAENQLRGGYSATLDRLRERLLHLASLLELELDFAEEEVEFADRGQLRDTMQRIAAEIDTLRESFSLGNTLKQGVAVAIAGAPNAGKSTLLNRLLNEDRALVSEIPGTTRDMIEETVNIDGVLFRFLDTAGIRATDDRLERMGIERTLSGISRAQIVIHLLDATRLCNDAGPDSGFTACDGTTPAHSSALCDSTGPTSHLTPCDGTITAPDLTLRDGTVTAPGFTACDGTTPDHSSALCDSTGPTSHLTPCDGTITAPDLTLRGGTVTDPELNLRNSAGPTSLLTPCDGTITAPDLTLCGGTVTDPGFTLRSDQLLLTVLNKIDLVPASISAAITSNTDFFTSEQKTDAVSNDATARPTADPAIPNAAATLPGPNMSNPGNTRTDADPAIPNAAATLPGPNMSNPGNTRTDADPAIPNAAATLPANLCLQGTVLGISAKNGLGIDRLRAALRAAVDTRALYHGDPVVSNSRHFEALTSARQALRNALEGLCNDLPTDLLCEEIRQVIRHIGTITGRGEITPDEILQTIFSKFCIGK